MKSVKINVSHHIPKAVGHNPIKRNARMISTRFRHDVAPNLRFVGLSPWFLFHTKKNQSRNRGSTLFVHLVKPSLPSPTSFVCICFVQHLPLFRHERAHIQLQSLRRTGIVANLNWSKRRRKLKQALCRFNRLSGVLFWKSKL